MGEGLFWRRDAVTAYAEPYEHLASGEAHQDDFDEAYQDFEARIRQAAGPSYWSVENEWGHDKDRVILRNGLFEITVFEDSYARIHVSFTMLPPATLAFAENGVSKRKEKSTAGAGQPSLGNRLFFLKSAEGLAPSQGNATHSWLSLSVKWPPFDKP